MLCDWGSSRLRAFLQVGGAVADRRDGPGIGALRGVAPLDALRAVVEPWIEDRAVEEVVLCGMIGSRNGLVEVPYAAAPVSVEGWAAHCLSQRLGGMPLRIAAGIRALNYSGAPDVMRGEETQIFGAIDREAGLARGEHVLLLPGTHSKWVEIRGGSVRRLHSYLTGELFALLRDHSSLIQADTTPEAPDAGFAAGLERAATADIAGALFETRSAQLVLDRSCGWARGFLSGLLIGNEVREMMKRMTPGRAVTVIGDPELAAWYARALAHHGADAAIMDGEQCVIAGLRLLAARSPRVA